MEGVQRPTIEPRKEVQRPTIESLDDSGAQTPASRLSSSNNNGNNSEKSSGMSSSTAPPPAAAPAQRGMSSSAAPPLAAAPAQRRMSSSAAPPPAAAPAQMNGLQSSGPPPFLNKTYDMVDDSATDAVVSWSDGNNSFIVWNPPELARDLLPKYFKHNNFSSFVRQLNTYGFRKVDPDRWEFANEGFHRNHRHLLKNIHRRKPVPHHQTPQQQQQTQGSTLGPCVELGKFGLEGEVERLKRDKNVLMLELVRLRQQQQATEHDLQEMGQRLLFTEQRQQQMMSFLAKALHNPSFVAQLVQQNENNKRLATDRKRRRLPKQEIGGDSGALDYDVQIVKYQPGASESARAKLMHLLNNGDLSAIMDTGDNPFEALLADLGGSTSVEQAEENDLSNRYSGVTLTEMQVCPREPTSVPMGEIPTELPIRSLLPLAEDATSLDHECDRDLCDRDLILSDLNATASPPDVYSPVPGQSGNDGLIVSEVEQKEESRTPSGTTGTNDVFWEQFLTANPESRGASSDEAETVESAEQQGDAESVNWWNSKPSMDRLAEQMGQLAPGTANL